MILANNKTNKTKNKTKPPKKPQKKQRTPPLKKKIIKPQNFMNDIFFPWKIYGVSSDPFDIQRPGFYTDNI